MDFIIQRSPGVVKLNMLKMELFLIKLPFCPSRLMTSPFTQSSKPEIPNSSSPLSDVQSETKHCSFYLWNNFWICPLFSVHAATALILYLVTSYLDCCYNFLTYFCASPCFSEIQILHSATTYIPDIQIALCHSFSKTSLVVSCCLYTEAPRFFLFVYFWVFCIVLHSLAQLYFPVSSPFTPYYMLCSSHTKLLNFCRPCGFSVCLFNFLKNFSIT